MPKPINRIGLRPQRSAFHPTNSAIGSMIICAAIMQADIIAVAHSRWAKASFWPTSGKSGALAK